MAIPTQLKTFIGVGRICDQEDKLKVVSAESCAVGVELFEQWLIAQEEDYNGEDVYTEIFEPLEQVVEQRLTQQGKTSAVIIVDEDKGSDYLQALIDVRAMFSRGGTISDIDAMIEKANPL